MADAMCFIPSRPCIGPSGCIETQATRRDFDFRYRVTPTNVPVVPSPATKCVSSPRVSSQISGPVVAKCARQFAGFEYWSG